MNNDKSTVVIRDATMRDSELLAQICESNIVLYDSIMPGAFKKQSEKFRSNGIKTGYDIYIIEKNGVGVGFIGTINLSDDKTYLIALYLHHSTQRQGIGHETMNQIINRSSEKGVSEILLLVHSQAHWAVNFYESYGFEIMGSNESEIKNYSSGIIEKLYIPNTYLMTLEV